MENRGLRRLSLLGRLTAGLSAPDTTPPTVSISAPANNATVSGPSVGVSADASDNTAVAGVRFLLNGSPLGVEDTASPYAIVFDSRSISAMVRLAHGSRSRCRRQHERPRRSPPSSWTTGAPPPGPLRTRAGRKRGRRHGFIALAGSGCLQFHGHEQRRPSRQFLGHRGRLG